VRRLPAFPASLNVEKFGAAMEPIGASEAKIGRGVV
jgi:hypothetical protein